MVGDHPQGGVKGSAFGRRTASHLVSTLIDPGTASLCRPESADAMNFDFTEEQTLFADSVRKFAQAHLAKDALKRAHEPRFPFDVAKLMSAQGLMGITIPEADGGQGGSLMDAVIAIEQVAAVCPRSADVVQFGNFGPIRTFAEYGTDVSEEEMADANASPATP